MQTKSRCHHRYMLSEGAFFVTEDGMERLITGENNYSYVYLHVDSPLEMREGNDWSQKEKRIASQASQQLYLDLL
jgi:hypothetical protein